MQIPAVSLSALLVGSALAILVSAAALKLRFLTRSGAVAASILGAIVFGLGGLAWAIPLLTFFFSSSILSQLAKPFQTDSVFEKTSVRDAGQVLANGAAAGLLVLIFLFLPHETVAIAYVGSLAAVTADTWGTECGMWVRGRTILLTTLQTAPRGTSGAISLPGTLAGAVGAILIAFSGIWLQHEMTHGSIVILIAVVGVLGSAVDSVLGAALQAQYKCSTCGRITERSAHCGSPTEHVRGFRWMTNDWVNTVCSVTGALCAVLLVYLIRW